MLEDVAAGCVMEGWECSPEKRETFGGTQGAPVGAEPSTHFLCGAHHPVSLHRRDPRTESLEHGTQEELFFPLT